MSEDLAKDPPESSNPLPAEQSPLVVRETAFDRERYPDLDEVQAVTLKDGPRARKEATRLVIRDRNTGAFHHDTVSIKTFRKKGGSWNEDSDHSVTLSSEEDEIQKLIDFLLAARGGAVPKQAAQYMVVPAPTGEVAGVTGSSTETRRLACRDHPRHSVTAYRRLQVPRD